MHVTRGGADSEEATAALLERVAETGEPEARIWQPDRRVSFGPRDVRADGYDRAAHAARQRGFAVTERRMGGHPVAFTGTTLAFVIAVKPGDESIDERYERVATTVAGALEGLGIAVTHDAPPGAFCPGTYGLSASGKIVGIAQRVRSDVAAVGGVLIVADHREIADVLGVVYGALGLAFDPDAVGSVARAGGDADPGRVADALAMAFERDLADPADRSL